MKKKRVAEMIEHNLWFDQGVKIGNSKEEYFFEVGSKTTNDLAEGVVLLMKSKKYDENDQFWKIEVRDINYYNISPDKSLYWLSGGDYEWREMNNYKKTWFEASLMFQEEFGIKIINILKKSKTLNDIRIEFIKHLNLMTLYEFALENEIA
jgi:hypothetical protein